MKKLFGIIALMAVSSLMAQELPILPVGIKFDFAAINFNQQDAVQLMSNRAKSARVILTGENHFYSKFNSLAEYRFLRMMHENAGVRNFVIELSPTRAYFMERYFTKEDSVAKMYLMASSSKHYMNLFDSIAIWNRALPASEKIKVHGLDVERFYDMSVLWLYDILKRQGVPPAELAAGVYLARNAANTVLTDGISNFYDDEGSSSDVESDIVSSDEFNGSTADTSIAVADSVLYVRPKVSNRNTPISVDREFDPMIESRPEAVESENIAYLVNWLKEYGAADGPFVDSSKAWKNWLGSDYDEYVKVYRQLKEWQQWEALDNTAQQYTWREEHMYRNMVALLNNNPQDKFYGQFGRCHTSLVKQQQDCGWFEYNSMLTRLRTRYFRNDTSVLSIGIFYVKDKDSDGDICAENLSNNSVINAEVKALYESIDNNMILYDLKAGDSQLKELPKKFSFVLVHDYTNEDDEDEYGPWVAENIALGSRYVSIGANQLFIPQMMTPAMVQHFADNQYTVSNPSLFSYQLFQLATHSSNANLMIGTGGKSKDIFSGENGERLNFRARTFTADLQYHTNNENKWVIGIGGRAWYQIQNIKYTPPTLNMLNPRPDGNQSIQSREWMPAGYLSIERRFIDQISLTMNIGYRKDMSSGKWYYKDTGLPYYDGKSIGGDMSSIFAELGIHINLIKDEE
jgi:hypothetical protein